ncbi:hypothetical protein SNE40_017782 [Patella caerulea]|uniref:Uncharacterized protein n=1 Tax=Patella caerulea TaxID=87958 RepID=A0AAN8PAC4_PATCE
MHWKLVIFNLGMVAHIAVSVIVNRGGWRYGRIYRRAVIPLRLRYLWVGEQGKIRTKPGPDPKIMVAATQQTSRLAHYKAALLTSLMTRHMPGSVLEDIATNNGSVGVFAATERLSVWPEYADHRDSVQCQGKCSGVCSVTCLTDGRKIDNLVGMGSQMAVVREDNLLCLPQDPYRHRENILVHEFAHTISYYLSKRLRTKIKDAYIHAKRNRLWNLASYAMSHHLEYFAEATAAFFMVSRRGSAGDMNKCGATYCRTEMDARKQMKLIDPQLYAILSEVYTDKNPDQDSKLKTCI